jgi:hypothetical protein
MPPKREAMLNEEDKREKSNCFNAAPNTSKVIAEDEKEMRGKKRHVLCVSNCSF